MAKDLAGAEGDLQKSIEGYHLAEPTDPWKIRDNLHTAKQQLDSLEAARGRGEPIANRDQRLMGTVTPIFAHGDCISSLKSELAELQLRRLKYLGRIVDLVQPAHAFLDFHVPWILAVTAAICSLASLIW